MAAIDPMHQFLIHKVVDLPRVAVPGLCTIDLSITNSVIAMMVAAAIVCVFLALAAKRQIVPGRLQSMGESLYGIVDTVLG